MGTEPVDRQTIFQLTDRPFVKFAALDIETVIDDVAVSHER